MHILHTSCSIIGVQAYRLGEADLPLHRERMGQVVERELREAINDGLYEFRLGMNMGADLWAAERVIALRDKLFPEITLHCYLPCETQANHWPEPWREVYFNCLAQADQVFFLQSRYSKGCMQKRTREMINGSARLIALHDNVADGLIEGAVSYAESRGIACHVVQPLEGPPVQVGKVSSVYIHEADQSVNSSQVVSTYSERFSMGKSASKRA